MINFLVLKYLNFYIYGDYTKEEIIEKITIIKDFKNKCLENIDEFNGLTLSEYKTIILNDLETSLFTDIVRVKNR